MDIGFIGLGTMESRISANLVKAGHKVRVRSATVLGRHQGAGWWEAPRSIPNVSITHSSGNGNDKTAVYRDE